MSDRMFGDDQQENVPTPVRIIELGAGFMLAKTLFTAVESGLFAAGGGTPAELAERCGLPERSARAMADLLAEAGLLIRDGERFRNAPDAEAFLAGRGPLDLRPLLRYWDTVSYPTWVRAGEAYRTRRGVAPPLDKAQIEAYESAVAITTAGTAADLVHAYDFGRHRRVLDAGGGYGTFARPILAAHGDLRVTLLDLPEVVANIPPADRLDLVAADLFADPLPAGHDAVLVANVVHLLGPDRIAELFRRLRAAIAPGGRLLLVDWWRTELAPHPSARFGAGEFLMISGGDLYRVDEVAGWLGDSGWRLAEHHPLPPPSGLLIAEPA